MLTALFIGLGSIGTRHLKNLTAICAQRGLALRADALRSDLARPLRPGAAELLHSQFTTLQDSAALPHYYSQGCVPVRSIHRDGRRQQPAEPIHGSGGLCHYSHQ